MVDRYYADDPDDMYYAKDGTWVELEDYEELRTLLGDSQFIIEKRICGKCEVKSTCERTSEEDRERLLKAGMTPCMVKELLTKIDKAIGK